MASALVDLKKLRRQIQGSRGGHELYLAALPGGPKDLAVRT
jgi:hypothetical protein